MLDCLPHTRLDHAQQDTGQRHASAPMPSGSRPAWIAVASLPKAERRAHAELHRRGFEAYLPLLTVRTAKREYHTGPLFPGYLFARIDLAKPWNPVRYAPGVYCLLGIDGIPTPIAEAEIRALQAGEELRARPPPKNAPWAPGMPCRPGKGHLSDCPAVILSVSRSKATVSVLAFGHLCSMIVPLDCLKPRDA